MHIACITVFHKSYLPMIRRFPLFLVNDELFDINISMMSP